MHGYANMVVIATPNYDNTMPPVVSRIRNASGSSFDVKVDRADGLSNPVSVDVQYLVVEEGIYTEENDGVGLEAVLMTSTVTDRKGSWIGEPRSYANSYSNPVVLGQVMSYNDPDFSQFWSRGGSAGSTPSSSSLFVGKHVAEDTDTTRADETIGYVVIEAGTGTIGDISYLAAVGGDIVRGMSNSPPYNYPLSGLSNADTAVASQTAMDNTNGSWAVLYGADPVSATQLSLAIDEDTIGDSERWHTTEQVAYLVFDLPDLPLVQFTTTRSSSSESSGSVDINIDLDNQENTTADRISTFSTADGQLNSTMDGVRATIDVTTLAQHTLHASMRGDGFNFANVVNTSNLNFVPRGAGPVESPSSTQLGSHALDQFRLAADEVMRLQDAFFDAPIRQAWHDGTRATLTSSALLLSPRKGWELVDEVMRLQDALFDAPVP
jgi:hypothetical protein